MSKKRFNGVRVRVEGERAQHASRVVVERGYTIKQEGRLGDDTGYIIRTVEGPVINLYDTGSILVSGNGRREFGSVDELRPPDARTGVLILTTLPGASPELAEMLRTWGLPYEQATFMDADWMGTVASARRRGLHIVILVSPGAGLSGGSSYQADPGVYYGIGLIVARISRDHFTVICPQSVAMPSRHHMLGAEIIRYPGDVHEVKDRIAQRLTTVGVLVSSHGLDAEAVTE